MEHATSTRHWFTRTLPLDLTTFHQILNHLGHLVPRENCAQLILLLRLDVVTKQACMKFLGHLLHQNVDVIVRVQVQAIYSEDTVVLENLMSE